MGLDPFIAAIASDPDNDVPRLVYADWLDENGQPERAEFIRLSCQLDPQRDLIGDPDTDALRDRVNRLLGPEDDANQSWLFSLDKRKRMHSTVRVEWRRGFVDSLTLPVQWFLEHGAEFRFRYPLLRKLVIFRLNGWGERLAACQWLQGIREIEFACWYSDADAEAVANSPHPTAVERLVLWAGGGPDQVRRLVRGSAWPRLREVHLVCGRYGPDEPSLAAARDAPGRPRVTVYDLSQELLRFPFAADFGGDEYFVGRLPDGRQLFAWADPASPAAEGWLFGPDGTRQEPFRLPFPPKLVVPDEVWGTAGYDTWRKRQDAVLRKRRRYLAERTGFVPAFIRVEEFHIDIGGHGASIGPSYDKEHDPIDRWGTRDDPYVTPEEARRDGIDFFGGAGESVYERVRRLEYDFFNGDEIRVCNRSG